ncbi:MAG TPA: Maf family protein [Candidatus Limnocylindria bacterium]|nr:Maf family protein [Candidatus Limnocylindria bacterium]
MREARALSPARAKAAAVSRPGEVALAADTEVQLDGAPLGKPSDPEHAIRMLWRLAGRTHDVRSEPIVLDATGRAIGFGVTARVRIREADDVDLARVDLARYAASGEALDKAGAYAMPGFRCAIGFTCPVWRAAHRRGRSVHDGVECPSWTDDVSERR